MKETLIPVSKMSDLKVGDVVRCTERHAHLWWAFKVGQDYKVTKAGNHTVILDGQGDLFEDLNWGHKFSRVVTSGEVEEKPTNVRYMYVITDPNGFIDATPDRDEARETKALFGGKREGVIITAYAPVKEIR